ncbi:hypothetical protein AGMMS49965_26220 [Bacteroidia bacterium]|nr:hypothetical protein AGMMS49965_26220 [Bacteroidia bacterium]
MVDSSLDFWLTAGPWAHRFETRFAEWLGVKYCSAVNSGSSANLLAFMALTSPLLGERRVKRGDEVITVACGFPTTVTPIIQYGAASNCAISILYWGMVTSTKTGTVGHIGTSSFYPPHHITMGEGGAVYTDDALLHKIVNSFRDWGRDCWCASGVDNTCKYRFSKQFGELPVGYDHKYVYSHFGYNLKVTDMQAAIGCAQLEKIDAITAARRRNFDTLKAGLTGLKGLILPEASKNSNPSWFGFLFSVEPDAGFTRNELSEYLENNRIQTRNLFAGNLLRHPAFDEMRKTGEGYRVVGKLETTDFVMNSTLWIGVYPGRTAEMLDYTIKTIKTFVNR